MIIDEIRCSLQENQNITESLKENILELILRFQKFFPGVSLENLKERLKTLKIEKKNKYLSSELSHYNSQTNTLSFHLEKLNQENDVKHVLMYELLHVITAKDNYSGFNYENQFLALDIGYTEILTNFIVGNESEQIYHADEVIATNLISIMIGDDVLMNAYFLNDHQLLKNQLIEKGISV